MSQDTQNPPPASRVKILLTVVIVLGILLFAGFAVVVGTIIKRLNDAPPAIEKIEKAARGQKHEFAEGYEHIVAVPKGAGLVNVHHARGRLILQLKDAEGDFIVLVDMRKGTELGRIRLQAGD